MDRISLTCETCGKVHDLRKTDEIPAHVFFMRCNWCIECEDQAQDYYNEWWEESENGDNIPTPVPDNQLCMPFIFDEIGVKEVKEKELA
jgi:hypothetical protein